MSYPQTPSPNRQSPPANSVLPDPLLDSGSFIHQEEEEEEAAAEGPGNQQPEDFRNPQFGMGEVIVAEPISVYDPSEDAAGAPPTRSASRRRNPEEMGKRPSWLPDDWQMELRVRSSGASAGLIDRYYVEPSGQHKFRSKTEVMHFLETGSKRLKRKSTADADAAPSVTPTVKKEKQSSASSKEKKSSTKRKKSETSASDSVHSIQPDTAQEV